MKINYAKAAAVLTLSAAATFAPLAAQASTYPPATEIILDDPTITPGEALPFTVADGTFAAGEPVSFSLTGENASGASLAVVKFAVETANLGTRSANADGTVDASIVFPANASGPYTITATSPSRPDGVSVTVTAVAAGTGGTNASGSLPATGMDSGSLLGLWVGGGALVLAGGAVAVGAAVHRQRKHAA